LDVRLKEARAVAQETRLMRQRSIAMLVLAGLFAFAPAFAPLAAGADGSVQVGNLYTSSLKFSLRCVGDSDWHEFSLDSVAYKNYSAASWNGSCDGDYQLRIGTTKSDGSVNENVVRLKPGHGYVLAKPGDTMEYTAYDARTMVVILNKSSRQLKFTYGCSGVAQRPLTVAARNITWIHFGSPPECSPYMASIETTANDGSSTTVSKPLVPDNAYSLSWNDARQAWDIQVEKQGGGQANDANN